jgi:DNA primase
VVAEGYKAAMWIAQAGHSVCATQGVSYTKKQVEALAEAYRRTLIFFDQDGPGSDAGKRLHAELTTLIGPRARLVNYPRLDAKQPDWLTPAELAKVLEES